jgi:four helix bundle protein
MRKIKFERLITWQQAMTLSERLYKLTATFPAEEKSGLAATIRRTVTAVPAKIADAEGRDDPGDAIKALVAAQATVREVQTHLALSQRLHFVSSWGARPVVKRCRHLHSLLDAEIEQLQAMQEQAAQEQAEQDQAAA